MTPRRTIIGTISSAPVLRDRWLRRIILLLLVILFTILSFFPERYRAAVTLTPTDPASFGLSGALGQLGAINSVFGNQAAVEIALRVARSVYVRDTIIRRLKLKQRLGLATDVQVHRWLQDEMTIRSLRGGILLYENSLRDPALARDLVGAYSLATQERLSQISRRQTEYKREVLVKLVTESSDRLASAQSAYDSFRLRTRYSNPINSIDAIGQRIPTLEANIKVKEVELNAARQFGTDENMNVRQILAELAALRTQLQQARATNPSQDNSVGRVVVASTQADKLFRELRVAQTLYDGYLRFLEGTSVEDLTSNASVRVLEQPFIDTERQIDYRFAALALLLALLLAAIEFYRLQPPVGDKTTVRETYA